MTDRPYVKTLNTINEDGEPQTYTLAFRKVSLAMAMRFTEFADTPDDELTMDRLPEVIDLLSESTRWVECDGERLENGIMDLPVSEVERVLSLHPDFQANERTSGPVADA